MKSYKDFKYISSFNTCINNHKWVLNFSSSRIIASSESDIDIYNSKLISKEVQEYDTYIECFTDIIKEINNLHYCNSCKRFDAKFCKICKLNSIMDDILKNDLNIECPICYKLLSNRYISICNDPKHNICSTCYYNIYNYNNNNTICPICRGPECDINE